MPIKPFLLVAALALAACPAAAIAQETAVPAAPSELTFERVYASPSLNGPVPRLPKLSPDGRFLALLRNRADDSQRYDLWAFDRESGQWTMLVDSERLGAGQVLSEAEKMQRERRGIVSLKGIVAYDWAADGKGILVPLDGKLYLAGLDGNVRELAAGDTLNPALSPTGEYMSFVRGNRLWTGLVDSQIGSAAQPVTPDEGELVHWGEAEFIAQEEMDRHTGYWWSPGDKQIAVQRYDDAPVGVLSRAAIGASGTTTYEQRYPAAGTPNVAVQLFAIDPDGGNRVEIDLGPDKDIYLARVDWARTARRSTSSGSTGRRTGSTCSPPIRRPARHMWC